MQYIFSDQNEVRLRIYNKTKVQRFTNMWKLKNIFTKNLRVKEEIIIKVRKLFQISEINNIPKLMDWR